MGRPALAGRPDGGDHGWVDQAVVLEELEQGDLAVSAPRLGGMARAGGVVIVSERYWAYAGVDGSLREGRMPRPPRALRSFPLARGLVRLAASLSPLFRRTGVARRRERCFLLTAILAPFALVFVPNQVGMAVGVLTTVALLGWLLRGRTLYLHGAEHRAIAVLALALTMELWLLVQGSRRLARVVLLPGLGLQRITTREPELAETRVALTAVASVLRREHAHR